MRTTLFSKFCEKQVVNCRDGRVLGYVSDLKFETENGKIISIFAKEPGGCGLFTKSIPIEVYWDKITKIGEDIILADIDVPPFRRDENRKKDRKCFF